MESKNPLEHLNLLEKKVNFLIQLVKDEKTLNAQLVEEKEVLLGRLETMENSLLKETKGMEDLSQERALTKMMVDELISNIDELVVEEQK